VTEQLDNGFPVTNADGEVVAETEEQRRAYVAKLAEAIIEADVAARVATEASRHLEVVGRVGDVHTAGGWAVLVEPPTAPVRRVRPDAIDAHDEVLGPLGYGRREEPTVKVTYPGVGDLTSAKARAAIARAGLNVSTLLHTPEPGPPRVVVVPPES
jgi:hypothetical protein